MQRATVMHVVRDSSRSRQTLDSGPNFPNFGEFGYGVFQTLASSATGSADSGELGKGRRDRAYQNHRYAP